jgi:hypothetical protein
MEFPVLGMMLRFGAICLDVELLDWGSFSYSRLADEAPSDWIVRRGFCVWVGNLIWKRAKRASNASQRTRGIARLAQVLGDEKAVASG